MLDGDELQDQAFTTVQLAELEKVLFRAQRNSGIDFAIFVGRLPKGRKTAVELHRQIPGAENAVLVAVDPGDRTLEIVTGAVVTERLDDQSCRLATLTMLSRFSIGDIAAGLRDGVNVLSEHARTAPVLHTHLPENS